MEQTELQRAIEAILFAAGEPVTLDRLAIALEMMKEEAWNTYYDVLARDINQPLVIQDAYRHVNFSNGTGGING